ncbi:uncharacterized protein MONOS_1593 [Monocercomonoides exilis]|uniref:uncharacterized protein n=1 Tax=Monocercomonoides exilis TaxID=2049356 RepID=UPI003559F07E|nr:hypothetical protein MONOS_1593 [Monocercomonoides exilis]|eukprot:MONOS_1593.1-p1 / transcript=MONOS_1593.1 / gene=MONOS_1593 / organism=Monocercomonoides_exilis_PA203 / gene_product=unspecified product / transcript_product=unspecified product / location=Mono_scaffold00028:171372-172574(+) / protein_length=401 / sequence_SO=supercontig / SO=protein_coding / is_pseudo=false
MEALEIAEKLSSFKISMKLNNDVDENSLLTIDSFIPVPNPNDSSQTFPEPPNGNSSCWTPPVYLHGPVCSIAIKAFECLQSLASYQRKAFDYLFQNMDNVVQKALGYLLGNWTEDDWKAIFSGSKFFDASCDDIYSSGEANFQQMADGLFCEEESIKAMITKFQLCAVKCVSSWLERQTRESITRCTERDVMRRIASLLCETTNDQLKLSASDALIGGWARSFPAARTQSLFRKAMGYDTMGDKCLPQPFRGELTAMMNDVCEEEGVIDVLHARIAPFFTDRKLKAKNEEQIKRRLCTKCDPRICMVCAMFENKDQEKVEAEQLVKDEKEEKEEEEEEEEDAASYYEFKEREMKSIDESYEQLFDCISAGGMSLNEYAKYQYNHTWNWKDNVDDEDSNEY